MISAIDPASQFPILHVFVCLCTAVCGWYEFDWKICGIPKGGKASPNRPWAICLSVWYEDRSGPVFDPRSDTEERRHKRKVGWAEHRGFITKEFMPSEARMKIPSPQLAHEFFCDMWNALGCPSHKTTPITFFIGYKKFHPIIQRQMRFIEHFVATKTYLCFNAKHIYLLVRNGQYWPPGLQTGTKDVFYFTHFQKYLRKGGFFSSSQPTLILSSAPTFG